MSFARASQTALGLSASLLLLWACSAAELSGGGITGTKSKASSSKGISDSDDPEKKKTKGGNDADSDDGDSGDSDSGDGEGSDSGADSGSGSSEGGVDAEDSTDDGLGIDVTALRKEKCGSSQQKTKVVTLSFPSTKGVQCKWGEDGNLPVAPAIASTPAGAIAGQPETFKMDPGTAICGIAFNGGADKVGAKIAYDDFLILTFDDFVLASPQYSEAEFLTLMKMDKVGSLIKFDHQKVIGSTHYSVNLDGKERARQKNALCPQGGTCNIVASQTAGDIQISAPPAWFDLLPKGTLKNEEHDLTIWITGQSHTSDCQHEAMHFDLTISYVE